MSSNPTEIHQLFQEYFSTIDLTTTKEASLKNSRDALRSCIKNYYSETLKENQPRFSWQGSMAMHTTINPSDNDYDLDDGVYIQNKSINPQDTDSYPTVSNIRQQLIDAIKSDGRRTQEPENKESCIRVQYSGYHIDLPIYIKDSKDDQHIPKLGTLSQGWIDSDPAANTQHFKKHLQQHGDQLKRIVMYLKGWKDFIENESKQIHDIGLSGFELTLLACQHFQTSANQDEENFFQTVRQIKNHLDSNIPLLKPKTHENLWNEKKESTKQTAKEQFGILLQNLEEAYFNEDIDQSTEIYNSKIFGKRFPRKEAKKEKKVHIQSGRSA